MACWTRVGGAEGGAARRPADLEPIAPAFLEADAEAARTAGAALGGDFYSAPPTVRGVRFLLLGRQPEMPELPGGARDAKPALPGRGDGPRPACTKEVGSRCGFDSFPQLQAGDQPQPLPRDPLFQLERTTLFLQPPPTHVPQDVMEEYARFLRVCTHAVPLPADAEAGPFCSRAKLLSGGGSCVVVATLFGDGDGRYALEFQRRYGDCVAFHRAFRQLAQHFAGWSSRESGGCPPPPPPGADAAGLFVQPAVPSGADLQQAGGQLPGGDAVLALAPLLDGVLAPVEVAAALAAIARTAPATVPQGSQRVLHVVRQLLQSDDVEVAFLAARIFHKRPPPRCGADTTDILA